MFCIQHSVVCATQIERENTENVDLLFTRRTKCTNASKQTHTHTIFSIRSIHLNVKWKMENVLILYLR